MLSFATQTKILFAIAVTVQLCTVSFALECFVDEEGGCNSDYQSSTEVSTISDCCLGNGFWYRTSSDSECTECIVYGYSKNSYIVDEGIRMDVETSIIKGHPPLGRLFFQAEVFNGTAKGSDYVMVNKRTQLSGTRWLRPITIELQDDRVAAEGEETICLNLTVLSRGLSENEFVKNITCIYIQDTTELSFRLSEEDYRGKERDSVIQVIILRTAHVLLANPVPLTLSAFTLSEAATKGIDISLYTDQSEATSKDLITSLAISFPANEDNPRLSTELLVAFPIVNDDINEADEVFVVYLDASEANHTVSSSSRRYSFCTIIDNDGIDIGFETKNATINESTAIVYVNLVKFPIGRKSEKDFEMIVYGQIIGHGQLNISDESTITFPHTEQSYQFELRIQDDNIAEGSQEVTLTVLPSIPGSVGCSLSTGCYSSFSVLIKDDDYVEVGFTQNTIVVSESAGKARVCVTMADNIDPEEFVSLIAETHSGSAGKEDYETTKAIVVLDRANLQRCFNVSIFDNNLIEGTESFTVAIHQEDGLEQLNLNINPSSVTIEIMDDDYSIGFEQPLYTANEADGSTEVCLVLQGTKPDKIINVLVFTELVTGKATVDDFTSVSETVTFGSTDGTRKCLAVQLNDDTNTEEEEEFKITLEAITPRTELGISNTTVIIVDDDVILGFEHNQYEISEGDKEFEVCVVVKSGALQRSVVVSLCTERSTAIDNYDFEPMQSEMTLSKGTARACQAISIVDDLFREVEQEFYVRLELVSAITGFHLDSTITTVTIQDDDGASVSNQTCDMDYSDFVEELEEKQKKVVETIVTDIAPELLSEFSFSATPETSDNSTRTETVIKVVYDSLSEKLNVRPTEVKFNNFVEAVTEIAAAEEEACSGSVSLGVDDIPRIVEEFASAFSDRRASDITTIRALYGEMLCIKRQEKEPESKRKKRESPDCPDDDVCECPPGGFESGRDDIICPCHFFRCLDPDRHLEPLLGFIEWDIQCLAFVIDTTGSMSGQIRGAKNIILEFVRAEEDLGVAGCYLLVPFNDVGPDDEHVPDESVGPITLAYTDQALDLTGFYDAVDALVANGGGDGPEYCLDGILQALQYEDDDDYGTPIPVMTRGSQIVILTDAPTKHQVLESTIISEALEMGVCIHFFVSGSYGTEDGLYQRVADGTSGTLISPFSNWNVAAFASSYRDSPCGTGVELKRRKRAVFPSQQCHSFHISSLAILFRFSAETSLTVTLTKPSGTTISVTSRGAVVVHSERNPEPGEWLACSSGDIDFSVDQDFTLDVTLRYLRELESGKLIASIFPPTECSSGQVMMTTTKSALLATPSLSLVDSERNVVQKAALAMCDGALIANMSFPKGEYTYLLDGIDSSGTPISYHINKKVQFRAGDYSLLVYGNKSIEIKLTDTFNYTFSVSNLNSYPTTFDFSVNSPGFISIIQPRSAEIPPQKAMNISVRSFVASSSIRRGSSNTIVITASNGCSTLTGTKTVTIMAASTPPPPDACGCQNGGTCVIRTRRGREFKSCLCPPGFRGRTCGTPPTVE